MDRIEQAINDLEAQRQTLLGERKKLLVAAVEKDAEAESRVRAIETELEAIDRDLARAREARVYVRDRLEAEAQAKAKAERRAKRERMNELARERAELAFDIEADMVAAAHRMVRLRELGKEMYDLAENPDLSVFAQSMVCHTRTEPALRRQLRDAGLEWAIGKEIYQPTPSFLLTVEEADKTFLAMRPRDDLDA